ncbi:MAG: NAD(P)-dependent oxidoreductase [Clostridia bacterium]|nr:NAD(P)-dependent oxidoreductase [Clostridia bacterium]
MPTVVITGADGFIGTHLTKHLSANGYEVYAQVLKDSLTKTRLDNIPNVHIVEGELHCFEQFIDRLPNAPLAFLHFAWAGVTPEQRTDLTVQMHNVTLSADAVRLAAKLNAKKFISPGSTMEYIYCGRPICKDAIPSPLNAYGVAKIAARYACEVLCKELGIEFIYTVISGIYSEDRKDSNVIFYTIDQLLRKEKPSLTRLEQLWDYVHIDDVVNAYRLIIEKGKPDGFYTIGHGDNCPLSDYIYKIRDLIDPSLPLGIGEVPYTNDKMPCSCVDLKAIYEDTGFIPEVSFEDGISRVITAIKNQSLGG